ncbi:MAG: hypothetical protein IGR93_20450 [Hydrococcus sp. C42_A2020_068]|uniref:hypothetical protein n=1 Tax=Pleurocapsa sp. PCC 7327 TaxID=118163 RepID=UPI00029FFABC|nr:hypothetical protein [Pleurocapsa sp. PCC 7327]AFY77056.1 hypothetical protein Ple7327_1694 [Pleurocapsa sp. PCC 7327]MBF2022394.1 hypothetical protein [Hydrococcus sp. C42_A2020_068]
MLRLRKVLTACLLVTLLLLSACATQAPSRFERVQQESTQRGAKAIVQESLSGSSFNKFFPAGTDGYDRVYTQEKTGFAEAKLKKDGKDVAVMAISDTLNNPGAVEKFQQSTEKIGGYPAVKQGNNVTAVLVNNRFQVKVLSRDASFTESDRQAWLEKFDLDGLAKISSQPTATAK